jgi:hypothetical protein
MSLLFVWEGEPPGEPLFVTDGDDTVLSVSDRKHHNTAHQEVRPPNFGFDIPLSVLSHITPNILNT